MLTTLTLHRSDPTRTLTLRTRYAQAMGRRFAAFRQAVRQHIAAQSDLAPAPLEVLGDHAREAAIAVFLLWLQGQIDTSLLGILSQGSDGTVVRDRWQDRFLLAGYLRGALDARADLRRAGVTLDLLDGAALGLLAVHTARLAVLDFRAFEALQGVAAAMRQGMVLAVTDGVLRQESLSALADIASAPIEAIGRTRAVLLAKTDIVRAHAEGTLTELERFGVRQVTAEQEAILTTAGDASVCPTCDALEGQRFSLEAARGVIPVHAACRCRWRLSL